MKRANQDEKHLFNQCFWSELNNRMESVIMLHIFLFLPFWANSQQELLHISHGCTYVEYQLGIDVDTANASAEANRIIGEIVDAIGLEKNFIIKSSSTIKNALASTSKEGHRYILYSEPFLKKINADAETRWAAYSVLAHEIGHHLNGNILTESTLPNRKKLELEADKFSGCVLKILGATLDEAKAGIETLDANSISKTHPPKSARREAIATGWLECAPLTTPGELQPWRNHLIPGLHPINQKRKREGLFLISAQTALAAVSVGSIIAYGNHKEKRDAAVFINDREMYQDKMDTDKALALSFGLGGYALVLLTDLIIKRPANSQPAYSTIQLGSSQNGLGLNYVYKF